LEQKRCLYYGGTRSPPLPRHKQTRPITN